MNKFLSEKLEVEDTTKIQELVLEHLKLLRKNFNQYFLEEVSEIFHLLKWKVNLFIFTLQQQELLDNCTDIDLEKYFWIVLYQEETAHAKKALKPLCQLPKT